VDLLKGGHVRSIGWIPGWLVALLVVVIVVIIAAIIISALGGFEWAVVVGHFHWNIGVSKGA